MVHKTKNCIICGEKATCWHGHVLGKKQMALGNYITEQVISGFCDKHRDTDSDNSGGCYGDYNSDVMGICIPFTIKESD